MNLSTLVKHPTSLDIYIASSWKNQHEVVLLTSVLRWLGHSVRSFVENNHGENVGKKTDSIGNVISLEEWCYSDEGTESFVYDTDGCMRSDLVIYIGPSGTDAWAEVGCAFGAKVPVIGLWTSGEQAGLMRRMVAWAGCVDELLGFVESYSLGKGGGK